jgi:hypothetical protein
VGCGGESVQESADSVRFTKDIITNRTARDCRERWQHNLDPPVKKAQRKALRGGGGPEDPRTAARKGQQLDSWVPIAKELRTNRTGVQIRTRFLALIGLNKVRVARCALPS